MEREESITKIERQKGAHLTFEERAVIQTRKKDGYSARKIAREIGCSHVSVGVRKNFCKKRYSPLFCSKFGSEEQSLQESSIIREDTKSAIS